MASETITESESGPTMEDMELENLQTGPKPEESEPAANGEPGSKREREEEEEEKEEKEANGVVSKKHKVDEKSVEEERMEKLEEERESVNGGGEKEKSGPVSLGPKTFASSTEMFDYFVNLLHQWPSNVSVNKYEYMVLLDLVKKGHPEPENKIGSGIKAFEVRYHPMWKSRCFFLVRADESVDDFSFRKCVDHILPLPENLKIKPEVNKVLGGGDGGRKGGGRGGGRGRGRGRGGKPRW